MNYTLINFLFIFLGCDAHISKMNNDGYYTLDKDNNNLNISQLNDSEQSYTQMLTQYKSNLQSQKTAKKKQLWFELMNEKMPEYWKGTDWDFNGTTQMPRKGSIACGYFVTTLFEHSGIKLNRVQLAQEVSSKMIKKLSKSATIKRFSDFHKMKQYISNNSLSNDVYIVGLDFHTGLIIKEGVGLYFFHSDYRTDLVVKEVMDESITLKSSKTFMVGSLMQNELLFQNLN